MYFVLRKYHWILLSQPSSFSKFKNYYFTVHLGNPVQKLHIIAVESRKNFFIIFLSLLKWYIFSLNLRIVKYIYIYIDVKYITWYSKFGQKLSLFYLLGLKTVKIIPTEIIRFEIPTIFTKHAEIHIS